MITHLPDYLRSKGTWRYLHGVYITCHWAADCRVGAVRGNQVEHPHDCYTWLGCSLSNLLILLS